MQEGLIKTTCFSDILQSVRWSLAFVTWPLKHPVMPLNTTAIKLRGEPFLGEDTAPSQSCCQAECSK